MKKTLFKSFALSMLICFASIFSLQAQIKKASIAVLNIDTRSLPLDPNQMSNLVRVSLEKLERYEVMDRYEVVNQIEKANLNIANCYGKSCLVEVGKALKVDYMYTGSAELIGQTILITLKLINVKTDAIELTEVMEFLNLPLELPAMTEITVNKMFNKSNNQELQSRLTKKFDYENSINNPNKAYLNLQGARFGYAFIIGDMADRMTASNEFGGYNGNPSLFQFGYQFEKQYLNEGKFQALFEFIPMISGIEQELFIPSFTFLNGFRNNVSGWEIAIGPSFGFGKTGDRVKIDGNYYSAQQVNSDQNLKSRVESDNLKYRTVIDRDGETSISTALVIAFGKSFKSGKLNIPLNIWTTIPTKDGFRIGISLGYNAKR
jgi:TolB-like protein